MSSSVFYESLINLSNPLRANVTLSQNFIYNFFFLQSITLSNFVFTATTKEDS